MADGDARRLLVLTDDLGGGTGHHMLSVMERLHGEGWSVRVASAAPSTARFEPPVPVTYLDTGGAGSVYPLPQLRLFRAVRRAVRDFDPHVVHAYFFWPILVARLLRTAGAIDHLVESREDHGFNWGAHEYLWLRLTRSAPDRVICVSASVRDHVRRREGLGDDRATVIHNGIEPPGDPALRPAREEALRRELGLPAGDPVVGMVANLNRPVKGGRWFAEAVPHVLRRVPEARFLVVGLGGDDAAIGGRLRELGVEDRVVLAGFRDDVEDCYGLMDVSVLTSLSEGLSITILESMAYGLPVVATRVGGNPELVEEGVTGHLVPPRDPEAWARRVAELLESPSLRERMGSSARKRVAARFALDDVASRYRAVYDGPASGRSPGRSESRGAGAAEDGGAAPT